MSDTTQSPPKEDKTPRSYGTEPPRRVEYATMPSDITLRPDVITLKRPLFIASAVIMILISLSLFWIPFFSGLFGGTFGGFHAGKMRRAVAAAVVCSVMVPALVIFLHAFSEQPSLLFLSGFTFWEWVVAHVAGTLLGAVAGAASRPLFTERELYRYT